MIKHLYCPHCETILIPIGEIYSCKCSSWWNCDKENNLWKRYISNSNSGWEPVEKEEMLIQKHPFIFR